MMRGAMGRVCTTLSTVVLLCGLAGAAPARAALSNDGTVTAEYSGKLAQAYIANPSDPAYYQGNVTFTWDETATFALSGRAQHDETSRLVSWKLTVSGGYQATAAPPNQGRACTSTFSRRPGARNPISVFYNSAAVGVTATMPVAGQFVQSSTSDPHSDCYVQPNGSVGYASPDSATAAYEHALIAGATVGVPSNPFSRTFTADGSGVEGDGSQVTQSLSGVLQVTTNGRTSPPPKPRLTRAEIQAKSNALQALKQTLPAALYPCVTLAAGSPLLAPTPLGLAIGGALVSIGGKLCVDYYRTILAEIDTVKDPPRSDFDVLASAGAAARAVAPARRLLAAAGATRAVAEAIAVTLARETGARRAHKRAAAARQDRHLKVLSVRFRRRRAAEVAAGRALAAQIRASGSAPRLDAAQVQAAQSTLLGRLSARGLSKANARFVRGLLRSGALDVRSTLGR
jgi:hypothetical protein